ncbi:hypothetical protein RIR_e55989_A0A2N1N7M9_9GLOM [Rhizophagus irregularis DAOM 181602=DAOM 197198]|uniref:Uncharacterized protein n=1 Tax=Rhizophagus irregularis TaxID=588596 RepID=A0A2N1N7M9_9GLOM|nr:hypothetical protein RhiirC2_486206 [Rhizophagus irregularis]GET63669.1 hypothetical protein RIR_e55989_A0A2N1N7M9_9GLOM [Rhizophagus irregularis DAOM 181602=DAOM 197198]
MVLFYYIYIFLCTFYSFFFIFPFNFIPGLYISHPLPSECNYFCFLIHFFLSFFVYGSLI